MGKVPGKHCRKGISTKQIFRIFPDDATAEAWFVGQRWPTGICCLVDGMNGNDCRIGS